MPTNYERWKKKDQEKFDRFIRPIIDKNYKDNKKPHFFVDQWGCLSPKRLPKNGELVSVFPGRPKKENVLILKGWKVDGAFHLMSNVICSQNGVTYAFQIVRSDDSHFGVFSLVNATREDATPGSSTRTAQSGGRKSTYG